MADDDTSRHDTTAHASARQSTTSFEATYSLTPHHVVERLTAAGVPRDHRTIQRWCANGTLDVIKDDAVGYFISEVSLERKIIQLQQLHELEQRRRGTTAGDEARHDTTGHDVSLLILRDQSAVGPGDATRHVAPSHDMPPIVAEHKQPETANDTSRHTATAHDAPPAAMLASNDVLQHPYVLKLEKDVERWQDRYIAEVRNTQTIQSEYATKLIQLQQNTMAAASTGFADYLLKMSGLRSQARTADAQVADPDTQLSRGEEHDNTMR